MGSPFEDLPLDVCDDMVVVSSSNPSWITTLFFPLPTLMEFFLLLEPWGRYGGVLTLDFGLLRLQPICTSSWLVAGSTY